MGRRQRRFVEPFDPQVVAVPGGRHPKRDNAIDVASPKRHRSSPLDLETPTDHGHRTGTEKNARLETLTDNARDLLGSLHMWRRHEHDRHLRRGAEG